MDEFEEACCLLGKHTASVIPREHVLAMARNMDLNKDGHTQYLQTTRRTYISTDLSRLHSFFYFYVLTDNEKSNEMNQNVYKHIFGRTFRQQNPSQQGRSDRFQRVSGNVSYCGSVRSRFGGSSSQ